MTNLFQPLDLLVKGAAKQFLKRKYTKWYSIDETEIKVKLSVLNPLQANSIVELYYQSKSEKGHDVISNGRKSVGITGEIKRSLVKLERLDLFAVIDPLEHITSVPMIENGYQ